MIGRKEAKETLQLNIIDVSEELMEDVMKLYEEYNQLLKLDTVHNNETALNDQDERTITFHRGIIESEHMTHTYSSIYKISRIQIHDPVTGFPITQYPSVPLGEEWAENSEI